MWALGVSIYVVLFGKLPFKSSSFAALQASVCSDRIDYASSTAVSEPALHLLLGLLDKEPSNRLSIEEAFGHDWFHQRSTATTTTATTRSDIGLHNNL
jgi:[calcium/calmodulin-dependent protein kinase] kinase